MKENCCRLASLLAATVACSMAAEADGNSVLCESSLYEVTVDFPGGNLGSCKATDNTLIGEVVPEDKPPINPSPWYAFKIERLQGVTNFELELELNYPASYKHRYTPKLSYDGTNWSPISMDKISVDADGTAHISLTVDSKSLYIAAQENLNLDWYREWTEELEREWHQAAPETIGYSIARHPINVVETNPQAHNVILLLGRAHPPEVPGAFAMREFVRSLASIRVESCLQGLTPGCRFFQRNNFVIVPLLNPDGVVFGHWRHNLGSTDLNRDWGNFTQPETAAVQRKLDALPSNSRLKLVLDFHSTNRDVLYVQESTDVTSPQNFTEIWIKHVVSQNHPTQVEQSAAGFEIAPRPTTDNGTTKNYFYKAYGVPAITFETGDNSDRDALPSRMGVFAQALVDTFIQLDSSETQNDLRSACGYTFSRDVSCSDFYCFLIEANKATLVSSVKSGLIGAEPAGSFAQALLNDLADADLDESLRVSDYLKLEERLIQRAGTQVSNIHIGRSRQDLHGTVRRMLARERWMSIHVRVNRNRKELLGLVESHLETIVPAYTHGVPSQPTTFAHQLLAYAASFEENFSSTARGIRSPQPKSIWSGVRDH